MFRTPVALMPVNNAYLRLGRMRSGGRVRSGRAKAMDGSNLTTFLIANTFELRLSRCAGRIRRDLRHGRPRRTTWSQGAAVDRRCNPQGGVFTPTATMLKTPIFWLMFVMMSLMSMSGLMVTSQMATYGADFGIT